MNAVYVLSDLHIAPEGSLNSFHQAKALAELFRGLPREACLVLAGDTFDLLQVESRSDRLDWIGAATLLREALDQIASKDWGRDLLDALAAFVTEGGQCVVLPGNHDPELFHPACEGVLREVLDLAFDSNLCIRRDGNPFRLQVGAREVIIGHGHRGDAWNDIDPKSLHAALSRGAAGQVLPPGSRLVVKTLNAFKRAIDPLSGLPRFPFVDKLKPEMPGVALLLLYLDPVLACRQLPGVVGPFRQTLLRVLRAWLFGRVILGNSGTEPPTTIVDELGAAIVDGLDDSDRAAPEATLRAFELALQGKRSSGGGMLAAHGGILRSVLRAAVRWLSYDHSFSDPRATSRIDQAIIASLLPENAIGRVIITGHTHAAREVRLSGDRVYLNTGTWTDLLQFPDDTLDSTLEDWIDRLQSNSLLAIRRPTYAVVDADGAHLLEWPTRPQPVMLPAV